ncbi:hypothetical protein KAT63_05000 [Candidatus Parcubacteria bacterium]|nr:hypothetical protein [Candidatus Parcubacteria bacterium]
MGKWGKKRAIIGHAVYVKENGKITNSEYQKLNDVSKPMASIDLKDLVERNILKRLGITGRGTEYTLG